MSAVVKQKASVAADIKALLVITPNGMTAFEIEREYKNIIRKPLTYREVGYNSVEDLLVSLPSEVVTHSRLRDGKLIFKTWPTPETAHVASLVQRTRFRHRRGGVTGAVRPSYHQRMSLHHRGPPPFTSGQQWQPPPHLPCRGQMWSRPPWMTPHPHPPTIPPHVMSRSPPPVPLMQQNMYPIVNTTQMIPPAHIQTQLVTLLSRYPSGLFKSDFNQTYTREFGHPLDFYNLGYRSLPELFHCLSDKFTLQHVGHGDFRITLKHQEISGDMNTSMTPTHSPLPLLPQPQQNRPTTPTGPTDLQTSQSPPSTLSATLSHSVSLDSRSQCISESGSTPDPEQPINNTDISPPTNQNWTDVTADDISSYHDNALNSMIPNKIKNNLKKLIEEKGHGIPCSNLLTEYKRLFHCELDYKLYGIYSVIELVSSLTDIFAISRSQSDDWTVFDVRTYTPPDPLKYDPDRSRSLALRLDSPPISPPSVPCVDPILRRQFKEVLLANRHGILLSEFPLAYKMYTGTDLPLDKIGVKSLEQLILLIQNDVKIECHDEGQTYIFSCDAPLPEQPINSNPISRPGGVPVDTCCGGVCFKRPPLPKLLDYVELYVSYVDSPSNISIQIRGPDKCRGLDRLMDQLEEFYLHHPDSGKYKMPECLITIGQMGATVFPEDNNWHRVTITAIPNIDFVEVLYIDYGNVGVVPKSSLMLLKTCFSQLPLQAQNARLTNISPAKGVWTQASRNYLLSLVSHRPLVAYISGIYDGVLSIGITDTATEFDIHINDLLVSNGYAVFSADKLNPDLIHHHTLPYHNQDDHHHIDQSQPVVDDLLSELAEELFEQATVPGPSTRQVKRVNLMKSIDVHVVNIEGVGYILGDEISTLLSSEIPVKLLLKQKELSVPSVTVRHDENTNLFDELYQFSVPGLQTEDGMFVSELILYDVSYLTNILYVEHPHLDIVMGAVKVASTFSSNDAYWQEPYPWYEVTPDREILPDNSPAMDLDELRLKLHTLQFERKKIIQNIFNGTGQSTVEELAEAEDQIKDVQIKKDLIDPRGMWGQSNPPGGSIESTKGFNRGVNPSLDPSKRIRSHAVVEPFRMSGHSQPVSLTPLGLGTSEGSPFTGGEVGSVRERGGVPTATELMGLLARTLGQCEGQTASDPQSALMNMAGLNESVSGVQGCNPDGRVGLSVDDMSLLNRVMQGLSLLGQQAGTEGAHSNTPLMGPTTSPIGRGRGYILHPTNRPPQSLSGHHHYDKTSVTPPPSTGNAETSGNYPTVDHHAEQQSHRPRSCAGRGFRQYPQ